MDDRKKTIAAITVIVGAGLLLVLFIALFIGRKKVVSPVPDEGAIKIIFVSPTSVIISPTVTPTPTPSVKPTAKPTTKPTPKATSTPKPSVTTSPTPTTSSTTTPTPTTTLTPTPTT